eukprot:TRINITY_DN4236_c0_g1_i1.p3 TRINITY_DN4236_c0_g1~~TRINITY_DN4236_c0_g1_i1.p3  ORF type:complete len:200 (+),score=14.00 TRINITY_DN4236_c0_g1_i1:110-709(+)
MSNKEVFNLPDLTLENHQVEPVLRCLIHTIVFNRTLTLIEVVEEELDLFDITFVRCNTTDVNTKVDEKVRQIAKECKKLEGTRQKVQVQFFDGKLKSSRSLIGSRIEDRLCWEEWNINLLLVDYRMEGIKLMDVAQVEQQVKQCISIILKSMDEKMIHLPPPQSGWYPFEINIVGQEKVGILDKFKNFVLQTSPPQVWS